MSITGILIMAGSLLYSFLLGFQPFAVVCLAVGLALAILGTSIIRNKFRISTSRGIIIYNLSVFVLLAALLLVAQRVAPVITPMEEVQAGLKDSARLIEKKEYEDAEKLLMALRGKYPDLPQVALNLSTVFLLQNNSSKAEELLDNSQGIMMLQAQALFNHAMTSYQDEEYSVALDYLKKSLLQDPNDPEAWVYASESAARVRDLKGAGYFAAKAVEMWPDQPGAYYQLARVELMTMDYQNVMALLDKALELEPGPKMQEEILKLQKEAEYYTGKL